MFLSEKDLLKLDDCPADSLFVCAVPVAGWPESCSLADYKTLNQCCRINLFIRIGGYTAADDTARGREATFYITRTAVEPQK